MTPVEQAALLVVSLANNIIFDGEGDSLRGELEPFILEAGQIVEQASFANLTAVDLMQEVILLLSQAQAAACETKQ